MGAISGVITLQFVRYISLPFVKWKAYEMGLIDDEGNKIRDAENSEERDEFASWKNIIRKLKIIINKATGGRRISRIASFAAALWLIKEEAENLGGDGDEIINILITEHFDNNELLIESVEDEVLPAGMYSSTSEFVVDTALFLIKEDMQPTGNIHHIKMYKIKDMITDNFYTLSKAELRKL